MARVIEQAGVSVAPTGSTGVQVNEFEAAIKSVTSSATVGAVFVYDTRNDSDGGAWRKKCAGLSWYDEALNQTTRGGRREFPSVAVIVVDNETSGSVYGTVTIYDGDDPSLPMWRVYNNYVNNSMTGIYALNGRVYVTAATTTQGGGLYYLDFVNDFSARQTDTTSNTAWNHYVQLANSTYQTTPSFWGGRLVNISVNDVAATVLEGAEIGALGLPIPTIACATAGGVSVIHPNGSVVNSSSTGAKGKVAFNEIGDLAVSASGDDIVDVTRNAALYSASWTDNYRIHDAGSHARDEILITDGYSTGQNKNIAATNYGWALGKGGLTLIKLDDGNPNNSAVAVVQSTYNTGYMLGDIRFAGLSGSGQSGDISADRSVKSHTLTKHGTGITDPVVATDAELRGITGFSASSYLSKASTTDFDFDTGDFSISLWVKNTNWTGTQRLLGRSQDSNTKRLSIYASGTTLYAYIKDTTTKSASADVLKNNVWQHVFAFRRGSVLYLFVDGKLVNSVTGADSINITPASNGMLVIGSETFDNGSTIESTALVNGSLSLVRISATAPTPQQVKEIYEAEAPLFRAGAKCLLQSDSGVSPNGVEDLAFDDSTGLLHVAQRGNTVAESRFRGLEMVESVGHKNGVGGWDYADISIVAANAGVVASARTNGINRGVITDLPAIDVRGDINTADTKLPDDGKFHFSGVTTDATQTKIGHIVIGENETLFVKAKVVARNYDESDGNAYFAEIHQTFKSNAAGTSQTQPVFSAPSYKLFEDTDLPTGDVVLTVNDTNDTVEVKVTGAASYRFVWNATAEVQRISEKQYER